MKTFRIAPLALALVLLAGCSSTAGKNLTPEERTQLYRTAIESARALRLLRTPLLDAREKRVVQMRYGLLDGAPRPQHEVAKALGISRSYVSRIEKKALEKLRKALGG